MTLGELNQKTVVGLTVQELLPSLDTAYPWEPGDWNTSDPHEVMTHSSTKIFTLRMSTNLPPSTTVTKIYTGHIGAGGIRTIDGFLWMAEGSDVSTLLEDWTNDILRQTDAETQYTIREGLKRTIDIRTSYLPEVRDILRKSSSWSMAHVLTRSLLYDTGPWNDTNRDSGMEQSYETSGLPPQACSPNLTCSNMTPVVVSGIRPPPDPDIGGASDHHIGEIS